MSTAISTAHIDYLLRSDIRPDGLANATSLTSAPLSLRRLLRVHGVGRVEKMSRPEPGQPQRLISEDVLIGLSGNKLPFAFLIRGQPGDVALYLGTWADSQNTVTSQAMDEQSGILQTVVKSLYPEVKLAEQTDVPLSALRWAGFALGVPVAKPPDVLDGALPIDRLIRALAGTQMDWACLVLAQPVDESTIGKQRNKIINELREIEGQAHATQAPSPLTKHYSDLLNVLLKTLTAGQAVGMWRTGVYLLGDQISYGRLASAWRAIFAGDQSLPEPMRIWHEPAAAELAEQWALPKNPAPSGPGHYQHPLLYQTMLTSTQLAAYAHLPQVETSGFSVSTIPAFDVVPAPIEEPMSVPIGKVVEHTAETSTTYAIAPATLTRHVFVAGVTGSGKTTTIHHLLKGAARLGVPFMVIEPAKTEYRKLLNEPELNNNLQVFTLGNEMVSPFRLNPFEVPQDIPIGVHIDLLRSVFCASFGMWSPLPEILEQCLHAIYTDRGWDIATNSNRRLNNGRAGAAAFPTLSDLVAKVEEFIQGLDYQKEVASNMRAALLNRLNTLRAGGKGRMLDVQRSLPMSVLLEQSTILELEGMGDDDDRAFMIGLLMIRLIEHRRAEAERERAEAEQRRAEAKQPSQIDNLERLRHLLVIEEAHRLLSNVGPRDTALQGNPRGKAVETFANLLAEIRAYRQGLIVVDQVPVKLAPDVIKNTNLKIAHRVVDAEDRRVLAGAMAMSDRQMASLAILKVGQAAVFAEGDDAPLLVKVPEKKPVQGARHWSNDKLAKYMASAAPMQPFRSFLLPHNGCTDTRPPAGLACQAARRLAEDPHIRRAFARVVQSMLEDPNALDRMWAELMEVIWPRRPATVDEVQLLRCFTFHIAHWFCGRRGAQAGWSYPETLHLEEQLRRALQARLDRVAPEPLRTEFRQYALQLHRREYDPYPACSQVCPQHVCLYRYAAADLAIRGTLNHAWRKANETDSQRQDNQRNECWEIVVQAADYLIMLPDTNDPAAASPAHAHWKRAGLCFAQQMLTNDSANLPATVTFVMQNLLKEAQL